jgi:hypothetical protein
MGRKGFIPANFKDLTGMRFGQLTVIKRAENVRGRCAWLCKCDCGNEKVVVAIDLTKGDVKSCGCLYLKDLTGQTFGRLTVLHRVKSSVKGSEYLCQCSCGNQKIIKRSCLVTGGTKSCGCFGREVHSATMKNTFTKHGLSGKYKKLYHAWRSMIDRCYNDSNKRYKNYGERDIIVCEEWKNSPLNFCNWAVENGYKDGLSIERKDINGNYEPDNCCWIPVGEQALNRTNTRMITINGITHSIPEWAKLYGVKSEIIRQRLTRGYEGEDLFSPFDMRFKNSKPLK